MDSLINAAARSLALGDPLMALKRVALREDAPALALRGIAMAQIGDLPRAKDLLKRAARAFGKKEAVARSRCVVAEAEIALVSRDLTWPVKALDTARVTLEKRGDRANAAHAGCLIARRLLLIGRLGEAERVLAGIDPALLPPALRTTYELARAGVSIRRIRIDAAREAIARAEEAAIIADIPALTAEVGSMALLLTQPAARLVTQGKERVLLLQDVEALLNSPALIVDACRNVVRRETARVPLATRPVLFSLVQTLAEGWPGDVSRDVLVRRAFRAREADESHRARLRVEIGRLREVLVGIAEVEATKRGFRLTERSEGEVAILAPIAEDRHATILALLADGEAWPSSALAIALGISARSVQRALEQLAERGKVQSVGQGRACRWMTPPVPRFPTTLLLPGPLPGS